MPLQKQRNCARIRFVLHCQSEGGGSRASLSESEVYADVEVRARNSGSEDTAERDAEAEAHTQKVSVFTVDVFALATLLPALRLSLLSRFDALLLLSHSSYPPPDLRGLWASEVQQ